MIKKVSETDSQLLAMIHKRCFNDNWSSQAFWEMLSQDVFFGFLSMEKEAQGFILGKMIYDEVEIITFCVLPEFRNRGIGKMLVDEVHNHAQNHFVEKIFLEVSEDNVIAEKMYENFGYVKISRRRGYYCTRKSSSDALVMQKSIR
ncbi:MAG: ribosomal protein S18-alanine N-acetyltransferase [Holosporaceae bacterium]|jgi:ribosomal-protein-alanine N-acetyltransferase|nr:ribosomal protein S18-alanine N-acetyltransferase [Holosporaceae bacterium]